MLPIHGRKILSFTCFWATKRQITSAVTAILAKSFVKKSFTTVRFKITSLPLPQFYNPPQHQVCLWKNSCGNQGTIFFPNVEDGWSSLVHGIIEQYKYHAVSVRVSELSNEYPICEFQLRAGENRQRFVRVMRDDQKWQFYTQGPVQAFEDVQAYEERLIKQKFTIPLLEAYMAALGWPIAAKDFWSPPKSLTTKITS